MIGDFALIIAIVIAAVVLAYCDVVTAKLHSSNVIFSTTILLEENRLEMEIGQYSHTKMKCWARKIHSANAFGSFSDYWFNCRALIWPNRRCYSQRKIGSLPTFTNETHFRRFQSNLSLESFEMTGRYSSSPCHSFREKNQNIQFLVSAKFFLKSIWNVCLFLHFFVVFFHLVVCLLFTHKIKMYLLPNENRFICLHITLKISGNDFSLRVFIIDINIVYNIQAMRCNFLRSWKIGQCSSIDFVLYNL